MSRRTSAAVSSEEGPPEPDRLEGYPHPREAVTFFGHREAEARLADTWFSGRLHHAWLIGGPSGVGKATLAYRLTRAVLSGDAMKPQDGRLPADADSPVFRRIAARAHPSLMVLTRPWQEKTKKFATVITVDEVRRLRAFLGQTSGEGRWRCVIVDKADELNTGAANALLKSLEEPPAFCLFLLVCDAPGRLPATIRSRCQSLRLGPLGEDDLASAVSAAIAGAGKEPPGPERLAACMELSGGSVGRTLALLELEGDALQRTLVELLSTAPDFDYTAVHKLVDRLTGSGAEASYDLFFQLLSDLLSRLVSGASRGLPARDPVEAALISRLSDRGTLAKWAELWETVARMKAEADVLNLDRKTLILGTFFRLEETARASGP
ncbi:MAG: DNA polymerase III subunit delta' [Pseudomonadota bacterium]|nr:DNA polymerase III subunit delta' [Pseudomonadota bacterium]